MKIYQLHEYGGGWEDSYDRIIGSYLRRERAEEEKIKAEIKETELMEHGQRCKYCPFIEEIFIDLESLTSEYPDYCKEAKLENGDYGINCENYYVHWDESSFGIEEVEVEE